MSNSIRLRDEYESSKLMWQMQRTIDMLTAQNVPADKRFITRGLVRTILNEPAK